MRIDVPGPPFRVLIDVREGLPRDVRGALRRLGMAVLIEDG